MRTDQVRAVVDGWIEERLLPALEKDAGDYLAADELSDVLGPGEVVPVAVAVFEAVFTALEQGRFGLSLERHAPSLALFLPDVSRFSRRVPDLENLFGRWPYREPPKVYVVHRRVRSLWAEVVQYRTPIPDRLVNHPQVHGSYRIYHASDRNVSPDEWSRDIVFEHFLEPRWSLG